MDSFVSRFAVVGLAALACTSMPAHSQGRTVWEDFSTGMAGSDHTASPGPDMFGDTTDLYTGATQFLVTDVSLPGNSDLPVVLQRSLEAADSGIADGMPDSFMTWTRYEVPYLSGVYPEGWIATTTLGGHTVTSQRCSFTYGPREIPDDKGAQGEWMPYEYWHGNHLYLPGRGSELLRRNGSSPPTDGATYPWLTKGQWYFSCLPATANGQPGEGFLGRSPDGRKYYFDYLVDWRSGPLLRKFDDEDDEMVLGQQEYRLLLTRVEDRFGNWVQYTYSGKDLTTITANDGRQLTLTYAAPGGALTSVSDGSRTWTYTYTSGVRVTFPDSTFWQANVSGSIQRPGIPVSPDGSMSCDANPYTGQSTLTIQHRSGAIGTFAFAPLRRGLSHVAYNSAASFPCPQIPKHYDNIALYSKTISGSGVPAATWSYVYGPANGCFGAPHGQTSSAPCTAASPTARTVEVNGPGTFVRYTFGNKYFETDGALLRVETGSSATNILRDDARVWQIFPAPGSPSPFLAGGSFLDTIVRIVGTRTVTQNAATYSTTNSNWDTYFNPQTIAESGPNGGSRTTQLTYLNDRAKWVIGQVASATSPGKSISRIFNANALVSDETEDGVITSYTYHPDGTLATTKDPRLNEHSFSNYKRGIPQSESHPEGVTITRVVDDRGFITSETNGELKTTGYGHDPVGRVTSVDRPIGNDVTIAYAGTTKSTKTTSRGGLIQTVNYDALWRPTSVVRGGITTTYQYDAYGRVTFESNPNDSIGTSTEYDALGRIAKVTHPDSTYRSYTYAAASVTERDERANLTTRSYRAYGDPDDMLLMSIAAPEAAANVSITRDPNGLVRSVTQAGKTRDLDYDSRNYLLSETHPETGQTTFERDATGNMKARTIGGVRTEFTYDGLNRLKDTIFPDSTPDITQTWSKTSKLKSVSSAEATRVLDYDDNDNLRSETLTVGAMVLAATYEYDANDRFATLTYPVSGRVVNYAPNALGRPTQVSGYATAVTYWPSGQLRQIDYANGTVSTYEQNTRLWPSTFSTRRASFYSISSSYGYDGAGNMTSIVDAVDATMNRTLGYDNIHRLTSASGPWGSGTIGYDGAGNIASQSLGSFNLSYAYDAQNRLASVSGSRSASYGYDGYGDITSAGAATYSYDAVPNMRCANCGAGNRVDYSYDGLRNRVKVVQSGVTRYEFHAANGDLLVEYTPSQSNRLVEHVYLSGKRIAQRISDTTPPTSITPTVTTVTVNNSGGAVVGVNIGGTSPSGTVKFSKVSTQLGTAYVASAQASAEVTGLTAGANSITAVYSGDVNNSGNSLTYQLTVNIPPPDVPASISVPASSPTGSYTINWGVPANGWVTAYELYEATNSGFTSQTLAYSGTALSMPFSGKGNGTYYYRVRACNTAGCGGYRTGANSTAVTLPPGTPTSIAVPASSTTGAYTISWGASTGTVTAYELYEATNSGFSGQVNVFNGIALSAALSNKGTGTYYYRVRACNTSTACSQYAAGANSIVVTVTPGQPPSLSVPSGSTNTTGSYSISWAASQTGVVNNYELNEATNPNFTGQLTTYNIGLSTSKLISGKADGDYYYRVRGCNTSVDCGWYQYAPGFSPVPVRLTPSAPSSINVPPTSNIDNYAISFGTATGTVTGYELYEATNSSFSGEVLVSSGTTTTRFISGKGNGTYYYRVRACNTPSSCGGYAPGPNVITVTLPPAQPSTPLNLRKSPTTGTGSSYTILWDASSAPVSYYILEQSAGGGGFVPFPQINHPTTSKSFSNQSCGEYTYQVKACSSGGVCSGYSNTTFKRVCNN